MYRSDDPFLPNEWHYVCVYYDPKDEKVRMHMRGKDSGLVKAPWEAENATADEADGEDALCLGSFGESPAFGGAILAFSVQSWEADAGEEPMPFRAADCTALSPSDSLVTLDSAWTESGSVRTFDVEPEQICSEAYTKVLVRLFAGHLPHAETCRRLDGRLPTESEVESSVLNVSSDLALNCSNAKNVSLWLAGPKPSHEVTATCTALLANGSVASYPCISEVTCSICFVPAKKRFTVYGPLEIFDHHYTLTVDAEGAAQFVGDVSTIQRDEDGWLLSSDLHVQTMRVAGPLPVGRHSWFSSLKNKNMTLTMTSCGPEQYSCGDNTCIERAAFCNTIRDCRDGSDESACSPVRLPPEYDKSKNPRLGSSSQGHLTYSVYLYALSDIKTIEGKVTLDMNIYVTYKDERITYWNLRDFEQQIDCEEIWHPEFNAIAGRTTGLAYPMDVYDKICGVYGSSAGQIRSLDDPFMGEYLPGKESELFNSITFRTTIPCNFKLHRYPFGILQCNVSYYILDGQYDLAFKKFSEDMEVEYDGTEDLLEYRLKNVTCETSKYEGDERYTYIVLTLHLSSLYEYHMLNSFAPSSLMFLVTLSTLFFPLKDFNERIVVSLTSLLVLATLFAQASSTSVKTPYFKLLDIWYTALISLCFVCVISNAVTHRLLHKEVPPINVVKPALGHGKAFTPNDVPARSFNWLSIIVLSALFIALVFVFIMLATEML
ncbi:CBN-LGC-52 protein [Penaeus vannamei]|uniref:CBN-LGC-52 protein n=1 Tax=Penaeus vannamei TaxID=6689 RepID=A0A3R7Q2V5_PENVA|nr:CBN-LGC-52 protein [Penaeus vannamei]